MDFKTGDVFDSDKMQEIIKDALEECLGKSYPTSRRIRLWNTNVGEEVVEKIAMLKSPFKYLVFTDIMENNGGGYHFYLSAMWDPDRDSYYSHQENRVDQHLWMAINIIGVSI